MDAFVFTAVLAAALMHAAWNALVKVGLDRFSSVLLLAFVQSGMAILLLPFFLVPASASWPWLLASGLLHTGYKLFLIRAYSHGELAQVYPIARGSAPLIVAAFGILFLDEALAATKAAAVFAIAAGVMIMSLRSEANVARMPLKAVAYAGGTACFTAAYTIVDAIGARLSGTASGFTLWMFACDGIGMLASALTARGPRALSRLRPAWRSGLVAGALSLGSYWIVIWAFTQAPVALVAALRETSVLFAMLIGVFVLHEQGGPRRWAAAVLIMLGLVLMRM